MTPSTLGFYLLSLLLLAGGGLSQQRRSSKSAQPASSGTSASQVVDFDCPEEFGYYPHPADCTQYYVCVFGGALLESCTGGLMYSHELQTCDWPRNVGCGEQVSTVSTVKAVETRPRQHPQLRPSPQPQQQPPHQQFPPQRQLQREEAIPKHHLYPEEELGPAEEVESDRQQRVYRGQPATLGQVARDRDGLARHSNALQVAPANGREKLSVISFGTQQQYSFPGDTKILHPSGSGSGPPWSAASLHFSLPLPPLPPHRIPPPWPTSPQHYSHPSDNRQGVDARFNLHPNRQTITSPSQFSKPIRFPIPANEDEFFPVFGQGVRLPKPAPELLITPSSIDEGRHTNPHQNLPQQNVLTSPAPLEKQPDNYAFFNLQTLPVVNNVNSTFTQNKFSAKFDGSKLNPANKSHVFGTEIPLSHTVQTQQNVTHLISPTIRSHFEISSERNRSQLVQESTKTRAKPQINLIASASHSEESQVPAPFGSEEESLKNFQGDSDYGQGQSGHDLNNLKQPSNNAHHTATFSSNLLSLRPDEEGGDMNIKTQNEDSSSDKKETHGNYSDADSENYTFPSPPKEFFEDPSKKYKNVYNPFSDPEFDFDKFFHELADRNNQRNKKLPVQRDKLSLQLNDHKAIVDSQEMKQRKSKPHQKSINGKSHKDGRLESALPSDEQEESRESQQQKPSKVHPGLIKTIRYQPIPDRLLLAEKVIDHKQKPGTKENSFESLLLNHHHSKKRFDVSKESSAPNNQQTLEGPPKHLLSHSSIDDEFHYPHSELETNGNESKENDPQSDEAPSSVPSNHRYEHDYSTETSKPYLFNFTDVFNKHLKAKEQLSSTNSPNNYSLKSSSNEEPTLYTVHRKNTLSGIPHQNVNKDREKEHAYDDEDYYASNEEFEYSDEFSFENLHSPVKKLVKPPDIPNRLKNIDFMTFDKSKNDEDYDEASIEEEDYSEEYDQNLYSPYTRDQISECNKRYKNHRCNISDSEENEYEEDSRGSEEYDYDEDEDESNSPPQNPPQYEVTENLAETQQHVVKSNVKNESKLQKNSFQEHGKHVMLNNSITSALLNNVSNHTVANFPNISFYKANEFSKNSTTPQNISTNNKIPQEILLKALSADQGSSNLTKKLHLPYNNVKLVSRPQSVVNTFNKTNTTTPHLPNSTKPHRGHFKELNRSPQITTDRSKLYSSSTLPLSPKPLKNLRQRLLTKPTNYTAATEYETSESIEQPMTLRTFNSRLTNSVTVSGRQSIAPPPYIEQTTTQRVTSRGYNSTQHQQQQYTPSPYDPYYNIYEDEGDLYKDIDYSQYTGQQNQQYQYKEKQPQVVQQQVQVPPSRKPSVQYSPPPPPPPPQPQPSYNAVQQDVYSGVQDYADSYSLQDEDIDYKQADLDLKGNRSRTAKQTEEVKPTSAADNEDKVNTSRNRHLTLTAAFSFDDDKSPVISSKKIEENMRQRSSKNAFTVAEPSSTGPDRDTHELVLSYIRQENSALNKRNRLGNDPKPNTEIKPNAGRLSSQTPRPFSHFFDDLETSHISSTSPPKRDTKAHNHEAQSTTGRPFRIVVPSSTPNPVRDSALDQLTSRQRYSAKRGNTQKSDDLDVSTPASETIRPYKLPTLTRETIGSLTIQQARFQPTQEIPESSEKIYPSKKESSTGRKVQDRSNENSASPKFSPEMQDGIIKFIPILPQRSPYKSNSESVSSSQRSNNHISTTTNKPVDTKLQPQQNIEPEVILENAGYGLSMSQRVLSQVNSQSSPRVPPVEESIVKLIPIKAVRGRVQPQTNEDFLTKSYQTEFTSNTVPRKTTDHSYQVTEDSLEFENYAPSKLTVTRNQAIEETPVQRKVSSLNLQDSTVKDTHKNASENRENTNSRSQMRFYQTTETPVQRPLYSLKIDSENKKYNSDIGGVILATLETITLRPDTKPISEIKLNPSVPITSADSKQYTSTTESYQTDNRDQRQQQSTKAQESLYSDPIRSRSRGKTSATRSSFYDKKEYNDYSTSTETSLENLGSEQVKPIRTRMRKTSQKEPTIDDQTETKENESQKTEEQELVNSSTDTTLDSNPGTQHSWNNNGPLKWRTGSNDAEETRMYKHKRRQLKNRNRLEPVTEEENNGQVSEDDIFDSEEETVLISNEKTTIEGETKSEKEDGNNNGGSVDEDQFTPKKTQGWHSFSRENGAESVTNEYDTALKSEITPLRNQNVRKMHVRKKIRLTPLQSTTNVYETEEDDDDNDHENAFSQTRKFNPISEVQSDSTQNPPNESEVEDGVKARKMNRLGDLATTSNRGSVDRINQFRQSDFKSRENNGKQREFASIKPTILTPVVDPYSLLKSSSVSNENFTNNNNAYEKTTVQTPKSIHSHGIRTRPTVITKPFSPFAMEINSYFKEISQNSSVTSTVANTRETTTPFPMTTAERIRDKFRLGSFPKPVPSSDTYARKPSVEDNTPPPLPSDRCSQELDNESECSEKPLLRVRPTPASPDSQSTPGLTRGGGRNRGSATYTVSPNEAEPSPTPNRGTPSSFSRNRPTLKPSTSIVSKAAEFVDIYRYPPSRPEPIYPTPQVDKTAAKCRKDVCLLPDCSCGGKEIPGDLLPEETPQIVLLTFDDSVNDLNKGLYSDLFEKGRTNPNGCPISATFYVSHEWTDYSQVQNLYSSGHEIASHSVSHSFGEQFSVKKWTREIAGQREILAAYGGVKQEDIRGMRAPFLAIGGNKMFKMLYDSNFTYDSSMPVYENKPPSWPYTLDYKVFHDCMIPPCPTRSYPGVWEVPMVMWQDLNGGRCSMGDACSNPPAADGVYKMLIKNFERHFTSNRSPFGLFYHAAWFTQPHHKEGFIAFLDTITKMPEVWLVTNWQAIQWVRDPTPISRLNNFAPFQCNYPERPRRCNNPKVCNLWHKSGVRYMRTCQPCPDIYPWTGKTGVRNSRVDNEIITE